MILGEEDKPDLDDTLAHFGVKGMKWGVRRERYSSGDIKAARSRQRGRRDAIGKAEDAIDYRSEKSIARGVKNVKKAEDAYRTSPDRAIAARFTRGQKVATFLLAGPILSVPVAGAQAVRIRRLEKKTS